MYERLALLVWPFHGNVFLVERQRQRCVFIFGGRIKVFKAVRRGEAMGSPKASLKQGDGEQPCRLGDA